MKSSEINHDELTCLLCCAAPTKADAQDFFKTQLDLRVPRTNYDLMWDCLVELQGKAGAAKCVFRLAARYACRREERLLRQACRAGFIAPDDVHQSGLLSSLFFNNGNPRKVGFLFLEFLASEESQSRARANRAANGGPRRVRVASPGAASKDEEAHAITSAPRGMGKRLEAVTVSPNNFLKVDAPWSEADVEAFVEEEWPNIDFGLDEPLTLVGRQRHIGDIKGRLDFLAKTTSGRWVVIELKRDEAKSADLTQLTAYMNALAREMRLEWRDVSGVLLAPSFGVRVLEAAISDARVKLLRFLVSE